MSFLIDTNVISELRKGERAHPAVKAWFDATTEDDLFTSVMVLGELQKSIERLRRRDPEKARALDRWYVDTKASLGHRVLEVDAAVAELWGRLNRMRDLPMVDGLLAATAAVHGLTLVTRNVADVADLGVEVLGPFKPATA